MNKNLFPFGLSACTWIGSAVAYKELPVSNNGERTFVDSTDADPTTQKSATVGFTVGGQNGNGQWSKRRVTVKARIPAVDATTGEVRYIHHEYVLTADPRDIENYDVAAGIGLVIPLLGASQTEILAHMQYGEIPVDA